MLPYGMFNSQNWGLATPRNISHLNGTVLRGCAAQLVEVKTEKPGARDAAVHPLSAKPLLRH